jgi:hypothetical protein
MSMTKFDLFKDQQERFCSALQNYDSNIWFPAIRGNFKKDNPSNWFICFVPTSWGKWKGASYAVHFGYLYARPTRELPERFRLAIGVESPMRESMRQIFKEDVISRVSGNRITVPGMLQAKMRTKLFEADPIPFSDQSWQISLERYIDLKPLVELIASVVREYNDNGAFDESIQFP